MSYELATAYVALVPSAKGISSKISSELGGPIATSARKAGTDAGQSIASNVRSKLAANRTLIAGAFGAALTGLVGSSISAASDLSESMSKVGVVFGDNQQQILNWADGAATALGQSKQQALEAAGTFGNLFTALGLGGQQSADMSMNVVNLASDLASFNNINPTEALDALRAGLTGETEPLKRLGVNMNEATLKAKGLELGLIKGSEALSPAAKAQAAYALIMEQTGSAQGDFARTSDGLANQQRIMAAQFEDTKASLEHRAPSSDDARRRDREHASRRIQRAPRTATNHGRRGRSSSRRARATREVRRSDRRRRRSGQSRSSSGSGFLRGEHTSRGEDGLLAGSSSSSDRGPVAVERRDEREPDRPDHYRDRRAGSRFRLALE